MIERGDLTRYTDRYLLEQILGAVDRIEANQTAQGIYIEGRFNTMSDAFDELSTEVQEDIRDDQARDARIAELEAANGQLTQTAQDAVDRANLSAQEKQELQTQLDEATQKVTEAVQQLRSSDYPNADAPPQARGQSGGREIK